jgi:hypothetical protein
MRSEFLGRFLTDPAPAAQPNHHPNRASVLGFRPDCTQREAPHEMQIRIQWLSRSGRNHSVRFSLTVVHHLGFLINVIVESE